jgi:Uma2 family endonuclease
MATQPVHYVTPEEYLKFDSHSEIRNEYFFGEIIPMVAASYAHGQISANTIRALGNHLSGRPCTVLANSARVLLHQDTAYAYPDATVVSGKPEFADRDNDTLSNPKLVVEVLSPTTRNYDLGDKTRLYWQIPSLTELLLIEQDKVWIEYWTREVGGKWDRQLLLGLHESIRIAALECEIPVAEIYAGVELNL